MDKQEYLKGIRKGKKIITKYYHRTQDPYLIEIINEFKVILNENLLEKEELNK